MEKPSISKPNGGTTAYRICVQGHVDARWADYFAGMSLRTAFAPDGQPVTVLIGHVADESALSGILLQISDMNLALISVNPASKPELTDRSGDFSRSSPEITD